MPLLRLKKTRLAFLAALALASCAMASAATLLYTVKDTYEDGKVSYEFHYDDGSVDLADPYGMVLWNEPPPKVTEDEDQWVEENGHVVSSVQTWNKARYQQ